MSKIGSCAVTRFRSIMNVRKEFPGSRSKIENSKFTITTPSWLGVEDRSTAPTALPVHESPKTTAEIAANKAFFFMTGPPRSALDAPDSSDPRGDQRCSRGEFYCAARQGPRL